MFYCAVWSFVSNYSTLIRFQLNTQYCRESFNILCSFLFGVLSILYSIAKFWRFEISKSYFFVFFCSGILIPLFCIYSKILPFCVAVIYFYTTICFCNRICGLMQFCVVYPWCGCTNSSSCCVNQVSNQLESISWR